MSRLSDFSRQQAAKDAAKVATDALWAQENGTQAYNLAGKLFVLCGIVWFVISLIPILCKEPVRNCYWMWIVGGIQVLAGTILVILSTKSVTFQAWADKNFQKDKLRSRRNDK